MLRKTLFVLLLLSLFLNATADDICTQPLLTGPCRAYFPSFGYNAKKGECERFVYGGCQGNENRFESKEACETKCAAKKP